MTDRFCLQNQAPNLLWAWVPTSNDAQLRQQDPTSFSTSFMQALRLFPTAIPNSTGSSVPVQRVRFIGLATLMHRLCPGPVVILIRGLYLIFHIPWTSAAGMAPLVHPPFQHYPHTVSDPSLPPSSPICGQYRNPFDISSPPTIMLPPPTLRPSPPLSPVRPLRKRNL